jgi:hypothetical protein
MSTPAEHARPREWLVSLDSHGDIWDDRNCEYPGKEIRVREVRPGERSFTEDEIRQIMLDDYDHASADRHLAKLFPEGTQGGSNDA